MPRTLLSLVAASVICAAPASANIITFDDLPDTGCCLPITIPSYYGGLF